MKKLYQLRAYFIIYIVVKMIIDIIFGKEVIVNSFKYFTPFMKAIYLSTNILYLIICFTYVLIIMAGIILFHFLIRKKMWARNLLLIFGWLAVIGAVSGALFQRQFVGILNFVDSEINWRYIMLLDRIEDIFGVIYWGFLIYTLQFNNNIKQMFFNKEG